MTSSKKNADAPFPLTAPFEEVALIRRLSMMLRRNPCPLREEEETATDASFGEICRKVLLNKEHRRKRTKQEIACVYRKWFRTCPEWEYKNIASISSTDCLSLINRCARSPRQRNKMRVILHGVFSYSLKKNWRLANPVDSIDTEYVEECEIEPLSWAEIKRLVSHVQLPPHRPCMAAVGLMLWAGIRPTELSRLSWESINWHERVVTISARHSKTGGCRHVSLVPVLRRWLIQSKKGNEGDSICPPDWVRRWRKLRECAQLIPWRQDVLRHTFASYHLKHWRNLPLLQMEMGHRDAQLLRTRYLSMKGVTSEHAARFWKGNFIR